MQIPVLLYKFGVKGGTHFTVMFPDGLCFKPGVASSSPGFPIKLKHNYRRSVSLQNRAGDIRKTCPVHEHYTP